MILERDEQLKALDSLVDDIATAGGRVVLVRGEAGIGKSLLIDRFLRGIVDRAHTLVGVCDDLITPQPFGPMWDIARHEPSLTEPLETADRRAVMESVLDLLSRSLRPTVVVLEDTQWADEATLDLIKFVGRRIASANGLLLLTYRDTEVDSNHSLRQVIGDLPASIVIRMPLGRLSAPTVASMVGEARFDSDEVMALTDGNPLFVTEVLASGTDGVPLSVTDAVLARAARLSPGARDILNLISVVPGAIERDLIDAIAGTSDASLAEGAAQGLLDLGSDSISFRHDLQRRAIEASLDLRERRDLNQQVLDALVGSADPARLVHHAREAGDINAIVAYSPQAARAAMTIRSAVEAAAHFRALEPHLGEFAPADRAEILTDWAKAERYVDNPSAVSVIQQAISTRRTAGNPVDLARTLTIAAEIYMTYALATEALAASSEAVEILDAFDPSPDLAHALSVRAFLEFLYTDRDEVVMPFVERTMAVAQAVGADGPMTRALNVKAHVVYSRGDRGGMALMEESLECAIRAGDDWGEVWALSGMAGMYGDVRDVARAADFAQRARDTAIRYEIRSVETHARTIYAEFLLWAGDWVRAENTATDLPDSGPHSTTLAARVLGTIQMRRGRKGARDAIYRMWSSVDSDEGPTVLDPAAAAVAEYLWLSGDDDPEMVGHLKEVLTLGMDLGNPWPSGAFAFWMWKLGLLDVAPEGTADFYGWIIAGDYRRSARFWGDSGIPYEQGLALMHGDEVEQIEAIRIFDELGAAATAQKVRQLLKAQGVSVPRGTSQATRDHAAGLTARQAEVLELLSRGFTNAEIADELFLSHRTVESHVSAVLMKLDVPNRDAAVEAARQQALL